MKVLIINNGYPSKQHPQFATHIQRIKECFEKAGASVLLLVMSYNFTSSFGKIKQYILFYWNILSYRNFNQFDLVVLNHLPQYFFPLWIRLNSMKKIAIHWHGSDLLPEKKINRFFSKIFNRTLLSQRRDTIHIAPSKYFAGQIADKLGVDLSSIIISPSAGVKIFDFAPVKVNSDNTLKIGFASELSEEKGIAIFLELIEKREELEMSLNKRMEFHYIFYGKKKEKYYNILKNLSNTVKWDTMKMHEMSSFYNSIDILLFPTKSESLGLVALEAMCCNKPVIGSHITALPEYIIPGVSGETFGLNNFNSLTEAIENCVKNLSRYNPRKLVVENYSQEKVVEQYKDLLKKLSTTAH